MDPQAVKKLLEQTRQNLEKEFGVIIVKENDSYIVYENEACKEINKILTRESNLDDVRTTLKLYLS